MSDTAGRPWLTVAEAQPGARIQADGGFTCISRDATRTIQSHPDGLWIACRARQAHDRPGDAIACAMFANQYVRAARSMQDMEDASKAYDTQKSKRDRANA